MRLVRLTGTVEHLDDVLKMPNVLVAFRGKHVIDEANGLYQITGLMHDDQINSIPADVTVDTVVTEQEYLDTWWSIHNSLQSNFDPNELAALS